MRDVAKVEDILLARLAFSRLRLPVPTAKMQIVHGAADVLRAPGAAPTAWKGLLEWVTCLDLESEVLEALTSLLLARQSPVLSADAIRAAIRWPSILSDFFIGEAFDARVLVNSWVKSHSGEAPTLFRSRQIEEELAKGQIAPPILRTRIEKLEGTSGLPFLRQWVYEFDRLLARVGPQWNGHWEYFAADDRQRARGQFITRRSHVARSAYLRTLALAVDQWEMPEDTARSEAMYATPVDLSFLKMLAGEPPAWVQDLSKSQLTSSSELGDALRAVALSLASDQRAPLTLLYLNGPLHQGPRYQADLEVIAALCNGVDAEPKEVFKMHWWLPGHVYLGRTLDWDFIVEPKEPDSRFSLGHGCEVLPALIPAVAPYVGYFHSDLVGRMPYLPANYSRKSVTAHPHLGGATCRLDGVEVGYFDHWNWQWHPTHDRQLGTHCGVSVTLSTKSLEQMFPLSTMRIRHFWCLKVLSREQDYGEWKKDTLYGTL